MASLSDRELLMRLIEIGIKTYLSDEHELVYTYEDELLDKVSVATIAYWLEELGKHRLIADVQPVHFQGESQLAFRVSKLAVDLRDDHFALDKLVETFIAPEDTIYNVFLSYTEADSHIAEDIYEEFKKHEITCHMAKMDIAPATEWQPAIRKAIKGSHIVAILVTPRSISKDWVLIEAGAAWILGKDLLPLLNQVNTNDLNGLLSQYKAKVVENSKQLKSIAYQISKDMKLNTSHKSNL